MLPTGWPGATQFPLISPRVSRLVCDLHRREDEDAVVPFSSDGHTIPGNIGADVEKRLERFHRPYHTALAKWLDAARPELIVALHSFTPDARDQRRGTSMGSGSALQSGRSRRAQAIRLFEEEGLTVGDNEPYSGKQLNATMDRHAEAHGRHYLTIEIRQDLLANEAGQARWAALIADIANRTALALKGG